MDEVDPPASPKNWLQVLGQEEIVIIMLKLRMISIVSAGLLAVSAFGAVASADETRTPDALSIELARRGADDPAGDNRGVDPVPHANVVQSDDGLSVVARRGADDPAGDDRGVDPVPHANVLQSGEDLSVVVARHGADDPAGHG